MINFDIEEPNWLAETRGMLKKSVPTETFTALELYENWARPRFEKHERLLVEKLHNGVRCAIEKRGDSVRIQLAGRELNLPSISQHLETIPRDFYLDGWCSLHREMMALPKSQVLGLIEHPAGKNERICIVLFDMVDAQPLSSRRKELEEFYSKYLANSDQFELSAGRIVGDRDDLIGAIHRAAYAPDSEGALVRSLGSDGSAVMKTALEIKAVVLGNNKFGIVL